MASSSLIALTLTLSSVTFLSSKVKFHTGSDVKGDVRSREMVPSNDPTIRGHSTQNSEILRIRIYGHKWIDFLPVGCSKGTLQKL